MGDKSSGRTDTREGLGGRGSPGLDGCGTMWQYTPGAPRTPGGREAGGTQGSEVFELAGNSSTAWPEKVEKEFHEFEHDAFLQQQPQPEMTGLPCGDTAPVVGSAKLLPAKHSTMVEVYRRAMGTLQIDDKMRSNMDKGSDLKADFMPLPVPLADDLLATTVVGINHMGGWKSSPPGTGITTDLQSLAVKNLGELLHRHGMWRVEEACINFDDFFKRKSVDYLGEEVKVATTMNWRAICDSFPQEVGCLDLERFCRLGTREYVSRFEDFLLPPSRLEIHEAAESHGGA